MALPPKFPLKKRHSTSTSGWIKRHFMPNPSRTVLPGLINPLAVTRSRNGVLLEREEWFGLFLFPSQLPSIPRTSGQGLEGSCPSWQPALPRWADKCVIIPKAVITACSQRRPKAGPESSVLAKQNKTKKKDIEQKKKKNPDKTFSRCWVFQARGVFWAPIRQVCGNSNSELGFFLLFLFCFAATNY